MIGKSDNADLVVLQEQATEKKPVNQTCRVLNEDLQKAYFNRIQVLATITFTREKKGIKLERKQSYHQLLTAAASWCEHRT